MNFTFKNLLSVVAVFVFLSCNAQDKSKVESRKSKVDENVSLNKPIITGADDVLTYIPVLRKYDIPVFKKHNKKVGVLTNQTGIVRYDDFENLDEYLSKEKTKQMHLVDALIESNVNIQKIYAPEHGFRG